MVLCASSRASTRQVRLQVSDGVVAIALEFQVTVAESNAAPVWTTVVGTRRVSEGSLMTFTVSATDSDLPAQPLTYRLLSGPWGLTLSNRVVVGGRRRFRDRALIG